MRVIKVEVMCVSVDRCFGGRFDGKNQKANED